MDEQSIFNIQKKIDSQLKTGANALLLRLRHEFSEDDLWKQLRCEWTAQQNLALKIMSPDSVMTLRHSIEEENRLIGITEKIVESEHTELHAHFSNTIPAPHAFSLLCDLALNEGPYLQKEIERYRKEIGKDYVALQSIISRICALPRDNSQREFVELQHEFEELLEMKKENGNFEKFILKNSIVKPLWDKWYSDEVRITDALYSIGKDSWNHRISYIEIRTNCTSKILHGFANAQTQLEKEGIPTKLKLIIVFYMTPLDPFIADTLQTRQEEPELYRRFVVGVDVIWQHHWSDERYQVREPFKRIFETLQLPITTHVGEYWDKESLFIWFKENPEYHTISDEECVRRVLRNVEMCVDAYDLGVKRLGHPNIIGMNIRNLLPKSSSEIIATFEETKRRINDKIRERGIVIETNPTSNRNIAGFKEFSDHPAALMIANGIRITANTDDKTIFRTDMQKELFRLASGLRLKEEQLERIIAEGKKARFG